MSRIWIVDIQRAVARHYALPVRIMTDDSQDRASARPRQVAMYLARRFSPSNWSEIGRRFHRDRSTVKHGVRQIEAMRAVDPNIEYAVRALMSELRA